MLLIRIHLSQANVIALLNFMKKADNHRHQHGLCHLPDISKDNDNLFIIIVIALGFIILSRHSACILNLMIMTVLKGRSEN